MPTEVGTLLAVLIYQKQTFANYFAGGTNWPLILPGGLQDKLTVSSIALKFVAIVPPATSSSCSSLSSSSLKILSVILNTLLFAFKIFLTPREF